MQLPKRYKPAEAEPKWRKAWLEQGIYHWDPSRPRSETFVVDTPPPTVSGSLHVGHVFSYTHQDFIVRYQRMRGRNIYYPMGWDDNGLPTERRVQNLYNVRCDPHVPYDPDWKPEKEIPPTPLRKGGKNGEAPSKGGKKGKQGEPEVISRRNFIDLCHQVTREDEEAFKDLWQAIGLSIDWREEYATIDDRCRTISQRSFLRILQQGDVYRSEAPMMWDVDFQTAVAQAEVTDKMVAGAYHNMRFDIEGGEPIEIATTRPELLPACVAVVAHPGDQRYQSLFGKNAITPLFRVPVPIIADEKADPEKGTGIAMICTFGDATDVEWWREYSLPLRQVLGRNGTLIPIQFGAEGWGSVDAEKANRHYGEMTGLSVKRAQKKCIEMMAEDGTLLGDPEPIQHPVRFYEKGEHPLEIIPTSQWFIRILDKKDELIAQGRKIEWHPAHMRTRYERWVEGLNQDWVISRQRYFGVPFPMWYGLDESGEIDRGQIITPDVDSLPVDPSSDVPPGYTGEQRDKPGGFTAELDVLDTWATSSMTPQICSLWELDPKRHDELFPMDLRPQSHEIIRTWAFYTIVKAYLHERKIPWHNVAISGWILDPDRKKMSKSTGNVVTPHHLLEQYSADAVRYWASRARLGVDTAFDEGVFAIGKRLSTKIFNASKFVTMFLTDVDASEIGPERIKAETDRAVIARARELVERATEAFEQFEYAVALQHAEDFFWKVFCDDYVELSKARSYRDQLDEPKGSALATLRLLLSVQLRMFAPFLPYLTEEIWQWYFSQDPAMKPSIHTSPWPKLDEFCAVSAPDYSGSYDAVSQVLEAIRGAKSRASVNMKHPVESVKVTGGPKEAESLQKQMDDVASILEVKSWTLEGSGTDGEPVAVEVQIAEGK